MNNIKLRAYAKINLILDLPSVLPNGYHSIYTVMQSVGLYDELCISKSHGLSLTCSNASIPVGASNTVYKAVKSFERQTGISCPVSIHIEKNIPSQAGLGGGSSDAAAAIRALDILYETKLSERELCKIALSVGADVPFCISGGTALCQNIGEVISKLPPLPQSYIVIVKPDTSVSTKNAYEQFDTLHSVRRPKKEEFLYYIQKQELHPICERVANVFEQAVDVSNRADIKSVMRKHLSLCACMSGSGSAVYGIFDDEVAAEKCAAALRKRYALVYSCKNTACGSEIISDTE